MTPCICTFVCLYVNIIHSFLQNNWLQFPDPVIKIAIEPKSKADLEKMSTGLIKLAQEDPSFHFSRDEETNQTVIEGMGELHLVSQGPSVVVSHLLFIQIARETLKLNTNLCDCHVLQPELHTRQWLLLKDRDKPEHHMWVALYQNLKNLISQTFRLWSKTVNLSKVNGQDALCASWQDHCKDWYVGHPQKDFQSYLFGYFVFDVSRQPATTQVLILPALWFPFPNGKKKGCEDKSWHMEMRKFTW